MTRKPWHFVLLVGLGWGISAGAGCGSDPSNDDQGVTSGDGGLTDDGGGLTLGGNGDAGQTLTIQPSNATLDVTAPGTSQQFQAFLTGSTTPVTAKWTIDTPKAGTIDANGSFAASAQIGGPLVVTATSGNHTASTTLTIKLHMTENPGNVDPTTQGQLAAGGTGDPGFKWLYPYDRTVFPRDLPSPSLQFGGGPAFDATMVKVTFGSLDYTGFYGPSNPGRVQLSPAAWTAITESTVGADAVKVEVTKITGGAVAGPVTETWTIAQGRLRGTVYYNSYNSALPGITTGAVLKLRPGGTPSVVISTNSNNECHVCHAVSADGTTMVAANESIVAGPTQTDGVYDLTNSAGATKVYDAPYRTWDFGALTPNGSKFLLFGVILDNGTPGAGWAPNVRGLGQQGSITALGGTTDAPSAFFDSKTGVKIAAAGLDGQNLHMMMPLFAPDGKSVVFNHYDSGQGKTVGIMDFDDATNTFSNMRDVATLPSGYAGWPTFTPDSKFVLFANGSNVEYDTLSDDTNAIPEPVSDIVIAHASSKTMANADALNGILAGQVYLPFGEAAEGHLNYEPTILPVAVGGYYWVVFTSRREYGNTINDASPFNGANNTPSPRKKLWVAALDVDSAENAAIAAKDISHPAFYLDGQELTAGNMRGFWALDPCQQNGTSCESGDACCSGFCRQTTDDAGAATFSCVPQPSGCAQEFEKCTVAADCCGASQGYQCINGHCARPLAK